ncbi:MAG TPA: hypothetical protein VJ690_03025 [Burkholderiales bacterium]|nr:hypothetical protein [Burkholderiales bacterium]
MQYTIDADDEFLRVKIEGRQVDRPPHEVCVAVLAESRKRGRDRILIELDQRFPLSPGNQFALVTRLPEIGFTSQHRIALVHRGAEMQRANEFINLVARNHGVMVRNFAGLQPALAWLRGETTA